jgi:hypothetical protein
MPFGIPHQTAVELWGWIETGFFVIFATGLSLILAHELRWRLWGMAIAFTTWLVWVVSYDVAEGFRNVNQ